MELLPELEQLAYHAPRGVSDAFIAFVDARLNAGCPVTLVPSKDTRLWR